jgi:hypothetical protein
MATVSADVELAMEFASEHPHARIDFRRTEKRVSVMDQKADLFGIALRELCVSVKNEQKSPKLEMRPCSLMELTADSGRFPIGDPKEPGFFFCGGLKRSHSSYCDFHHRVCYSPNRRIVYVKPEPDDGAPLMAAE